MDYSLSKLDPVRTLKPCIFKELRTAVASRTAVAPRNAVAPRTLIFQTVSCLHIA